MKDERKLVVGADKAPRKPNILLLLPDQHRGDWMPYTDETFEKLQMAAIPLKMPNIEALMRGGVVFTNAVSPSPLCAPARACLASGLRYNSCRVPDNRTDYPTDQKTFYSVLKEGGYTVASVGKLDLHKNTNFWGIDGWTDSLGEMGFTKAIDNAGKFDAAASFYDSAAKDPYMNYLNKIGFAKYYSGNIMKRGHSIDPVDLPEEAYCDNWIGKNGVNMLKSFPDNQPWFLQVNFNGPHNPWDITRRMRDNWKNVIFPAPAGAESEDCNGIRQNYAAMLENIDRNIGLLFHEVKKRGEWDDTVIIYSSDHGEMLGDFGKYLKGIPQRGSVSIPLVIGGRGIRKGAVSDALAELQDLTATITDYAGLSMPQARDSRSLRHILSGIDTEHRRVQISALKSWSLVKDQAYKLVLRNQTAMLYNLKNDPWELSDIADKSPDIVKEYLHLLETEQQTGRGSASGGKG